MPGRYFRLAFLITLAAMSMRAQTGGSPGVPGEVPPLQRASEARAASSNWLITGFRVANDFDDNALNAGHGGQFDMISAIESHLGWEVSRSQVDWTVDYRLGASLCRQPEFNASRSHLLGADLRIRPTRRMQLRLHNDFIESTDPFDRSPAGASVGGGVLDRPNDSILASGLRRSSEQAALDLTYATSPHGVAGISGSFFMVNYGAPAVVQPASARFEDANSVSGHGFYSHHLTARYWAGLEYNIQRLQDFSGLSRTLVHSAFFTQTISLSPDSAFSVFAGPEHSSMIGPNPSLIGLTGGTPGPRLAWSWAGGGIYRWSRSRTGLTASAYRKISDGGGLLGIVRLDGLSADLRQQLTSRWAAELLSAYDYNQLLTGSGALSTFSMTGGLTCRVNRELTLDFRYWRGHVPASSVLAATAATADHNRVSISLAYDFKSPLGR